MKCRLLISALIGCMLTSVTLKAQTNVSGIISSNTTWNNAGSPYSLTADVTVNAGVTLTIDPGVEVIFNHYTYDLQVYGTLISQGTSADTIEFRSAGIGGRVRLMGSSTGNVVRYASFSSLGAFNNPALEVYSSHTAVSNCDFNNCEVGITVYNESVFPVDSCNFVSNSDYGINVQSGRPTITNCVIDASWNGIYLADSAHVINNTIKNHSNSSSFGVHIDGNFYVELTGNTFTNNNQDVLTHPALLDDTLYDGNGLTVVHVDNKTIGQSTVWHKPAFPEDWEYHFTGDVTLSAGDTLVLEPGIQIGFPHYTYDLMIDGHLVSEGILEDSIHFGMGHFGGSVQMRGTSSGAFRYTRFFKVGSFNNPALRSYTSNMTVRHTVFQDCEVGITTYSEAQPYIDSSYFYNSTDWAMRVLSGMPTIRECVMDGGGSGIYLLDSAIIEDNQITNNNKYSGSLGIHIDDVIFPRISDNVISGNPKDVLTHPAVMDDTLFDNNGLSVIDVDNKVIGQTVLWHEPVLPENWHYRMTGDVTVNAGDTLTMEPGLSLEFPHYTYDLLINGALISVGTPSDSILYWPTSLGGRIWLGATSNGNVFRYSSIRKLGSFNNAGLEVRSSGTDIKHTVFDGCEVGMSVYSGAKPLMDSCSILNSTDWAVRVLSGEPTVQNCLIDGGGGGFDLLDSAIVRLNTIQNINRYSTSTAFFIENIIYPFLSDNVLNNNNIQVRTHPAVVDDTLFDRNGISLIHIDNKVIGQSTIWHQPVLPESWHYTLDGDVTVNSGDSLTLEPGLSLQFKHYTHDLLINGTLLAEGNEVDSIFFWPTSIGGRVQLTAQSANSIFAFCRFEKLGAFNNAGLEISSDAHIRRSTFLDNEVGIMVKGSGNVTIDSIVLESSTDYGLRVTGGMANISYSCISNNYIGVSSLTGTTADARNNWWGDASGPYNAALNSSGLGDEVEDSVLFSPWLGTSPCIPDVPPQVLTVSPVDNATNVPVGAQLKVYFDEDVMQGSVGQVQVMRLADSAVVYAQSIWHSSITMGGDSVIVNPGLLPPGTDLFVNIDSTAIEDLNGLQFAGILTNHEWNFTTEPDLDGDGFTLSQGDCDDLDSLEFPGQVWFRDADNDGFGDPNNSLTQCERPAGYILDSLDCDDTDSLEFPGQIWYADLDGDGFGDPNNSLTQCLRPAGYLLDSLDCDDTDSLQFPGQVWYADTDNDGFGDPNNTLIQCLQPQGYLLDSLDCDDTDSLEFPGQIWYADMDGDGFGDPNNSLVQCLRPQGYLLDSLDCDDTDSLEFPAQTWYADLDGDGFGDPNNSLVQCERPAGYLLDNADCDDADSLEFPGQIWYADNDGDQFGDPNNFLIQCEQPPGYLLDSLDCDDTDSLEFPGQIWYADADSDQFGDPNNFLVQCERPAGHVLDSTDCDDNDPLTFPGADEIDDDKDNDCDGEIDEGLPNGIQALNQDQFSMGPNPANDEIHVSWKATEGEQVSVKIYSPDGRLVFNENRHGPGFTVDVQNLGSSWYVIQMEVNGRSVHRRFVVHR